MRRLLVTTFLTLDGVMQAPGGPGEDDDAGFPYGGWSVNYWDDTLDEVMGKTTGKPFAMLLGRKSYEHPRALLADGPGRGGWGRAERSDEVRGVARHPRTDLAELGAAPG